MKRWVIVVGIAGLLLFVTVLVIFQRYAAFHSSSPANTTSRATTVEWKLDKGQIWVASGTPPECPTAPILTMPTDINSVVSILNPGQVRGDAYKSSGGFRFSDTTPDNQALVTVPLDAEIIRGSRQLRDGGEYQYSFELLNSCGIWYSLGHLLELSPKFQAIANGLPLVDFTQGFQSVQFSDVTPPVVVKTGEVVATRVGFALTHNIFFEWTVLDLRHKNGFTISPEWATKYGTEFDEYAVCGIEMLPPEDTARLKALHSSTVESGTKSDYCK